MIPPNELRLGVVVSTAIMGECIVYDYSDNGFVGITKITDGSAGSARVPYEHLHPIHITPEWLERVGFNVTGIDKNICHYWNDPIWIVSGGLSGDGFKYLANQRHVDMFYVHQLQNLYHALTGKELDVKELTTSNE